VAPNKGKKRRKLQQSGVSGGPFTAAAGAAGIAGEAALGPQDRVTKGETVEVEGTGLLTTNASSRANKKGHKIRSAEALGGADLKRQRQD
jgi:FtsP/CotA-like multicopper oxidase with cupredoxin domain